MVWCGVELPQPQWTGKDSEFFLFFLDFIFFKKKEVIAPILGGRGEMQLKDTWILFEGFSKPDGETGHARRRNTRGNKMPDFISLLKASLTPY